MSNKAATEWVNKQQSDDITAFLPANIPNEPLEELAHEAFRVIEYCHQASHFNLRELWQLGPNIRYLVEWIQRYLQIDAEPLDGPYDDREEIFLATRYYSVKIIKELERRKSKADVIEPNGQEAYVTTKTMLTGHGRFSALLTGLT